RTALCRTRQGLGAARADGAAGNERHPPGVHRRRSHRRSRLRRGRGIGRLRHIGGPAAPVRGALPAEGCRRSTIVAGAPVQPDLNLWPIGNCQVSALVDGTGRFVWACVPRVDGEPVFSALIDGEEPAAGFWEIALEGCIATEISYVRNTAVLVTRHR